VPVVPAEELLLGLVDDVVFKLPLVLSCVVLVLPGLLLVLPYVEPVELEGDVEDVELLDGEVEEVPVPYVDPDELEGLVEVLLEGEL
jgi:hypothetical protein